MVAFEVSSQYGWVVLAAGIGPVLTNFYLSGPVMAARSKLNVPYPNCYAVPGYHKNADEFNRVQRSHQNYLENIGQYSTMTLIGGLKYPLVCAAGSILYYVGSVLYQKGYIDTSLDAKDARYKKGGIVKWIGYLISFYSTCALAYDLIQG
eukprot:CAMPEP_0117001658 /NCGR_PEP_ID=MMETSP0472-20121206/3582_1 /TAXON_ID=693140 ORGANISM="Tiarina fusus, Strain LIS" /NCGR_SAMPLE_ID=MMETSP0472 /ASSEMBLY_ACC=CAM_ASM_000603 /LENGTH=149 /DNA_ID=CAMNT_0004701735 /DNA_START=67 /DNA_END=516 /DNA_ORIENTATION=-